MSANANNTIGNELPPEAVELQKEARILDLCTLAKRTTEKLAEYEAEIDDTKKKLENFIGARECFNKKAAHAAKVLAGCGAIENDKVDEFVSKVAEDPSGVWDFVEKMAESISAPTLGSASESFSSRSVDDPWAKLVFGGCQGSNGYVD
jgi:hypothetical protein